MDTRLPEASIIADQTTKDETFYDKIKPNRTKKGVTDTVTPGAHEFFGIAGLMD